MPTLRHCTAVAALLTLTVGLAARQPDAEPATGEATFEVFVRGTRAGTIRTNLARSGGAWVVSSTGGFGDLTINRFEARYSADWQPQRLQIEATQGERRYGLLTSFTVTTAVNEITQNGQTSSKTDQISARAVLLPNNFFGAYEALAPRLAASAAGAEIPIYVAPQAEIRARVTDVAEETLQSPQGTIHIRTFTLSLANPGGPVAARVTVDGRQRFAKLEIPAAGVTVVRQDVSGVGTRTETFRNPTDTDVTIPAAGFVLAGTLTMPPGVEGRLRHPTILLVPGSGRLDRDETVAGIPIFAQLAGALASQGFMVLRYDKRGVGQSGGRTETATLQDYAADVIDIVRWLDDRKDVDDRHLTVLGHSEGGAVAMLAASREKKIDALVLVGTPGSTGAELILEQQRHALDVMKTAPEERDQKIALQKKIQEAVVSGKGWEGVPDELRAQADTPWFRSLLEFDPAEVMPRIKQPILIVQGDLDTQVPPAHAERLAALARARKDDAVTEVVHLPGVNHLLVPAKTGEVREYPSLAESSVSPDAATMIGNWLRR